MRRPDADEAARFIELSDFLWYQRFDLCDGIATPGVRDVYAALDACEAPRDMSGLTVLDVGTTNGGVSFEAERRGARRILATDVYAPGHYGFDQLSAFLGSKAEFRTLSVYELDQLSEVFDIVLLLGVLYHLRHPLLALDQAYAVTRAGGRLFLETEIADWKLGEEPGVLFYRDDSLAGDSSNWWSPTMSALRGWLETSGFTVLSEHVWPEHAPHRAAVSAERVCEVPLYQLISYDLPLTTRTVPAGMTTDRTGAESHQETIRRLSRASQELAAALSDATRTADASETATSDAATTSQQAEPEVRVEDTRQSGVRHAARALAWPARRLLDSRFQGLAQQVDQKQIDLFDRLEALRREGLRHNQAELGALTRILTMLEQFLSVTRDGAPDVSTKSFEGQPMGSVEAERAPYLVDSPSDPDVTVTPDNQLDAHRLAFTGSCNRDTFDAACSQHDLWYHSFYFTNGYHVRGAYNIGQDIAAYGFPDVTGKTVLDVGTGSGWFAIYLEQQGARVTAVDARGYTDFDIQGQHTHPPIEIEKPHPDAYTDDGRPVYFSPVSRGLWIMRDLLGSDVEYRNSRVYDLTPEFFGSTFDLVFMGALLLHLRDPIGALQACRRVCHGELIATTPILDDSFGLVGTSMMLPWAGFDPIGWWQPNLACYEKWFEMAGFADVDVSRSVTLTSDLPRPHPDDPGRLWNPTQLLRVAHAHV